MNYLKINLDIKIDIMGADAYPGWSPNGFHPPGMDRESKWSKYHRSEDDYYEYGDRSNPFFDPFVEEEESTYFNKSNPWKILQINKTDDESIIRKAYYKLCRVHHPDKGGNEEDFKSLNDAYESAMRNT